MNILHVYSTRILYFCCFSVLWYSLSSYPIPTSVPQLQSAGVAIILTRQPVTSCLSLALAALGAYLLPTLMSTCSPSLRFCSLPNTLLSLLPIDNVYEQTFLEVAPLLEPNPSSFLLLTLKIK